MRPENFDYDALAATLAVEYDDPSITGEYLRGLDERGVEQWEAAKMSAASMTGF